MRVRGKNSGIFVWQMLSIITKTIAPAPAKFGETVGAGSRNVSAIKIFGKERRHVWESQLL